METGLGAVRIRLVSQGVVGVGSIAEELERVQSGGPVTVGATKRTSVSMTEINLFFEPKSTPARSHCLDSLPFIRYIEKTCYIADVLHLSR